MDCRIGRAVPNWQTAVFTAYTPVATLPTCQLRCWPAISSSAEIKIDDTAAMSFRRSPERNGHC